VSRICSSDDAQADKHLQDLFWESILFFGLILRDAVMVAPACATNIVQTTRCGLLAFAGNLKSSRRVTIAVRVIMVDPASVPKGDELVTRSAFDIGTAGVPVAVTPPGNEKAQVAATTVTA
jgi:hypothetical protein